MAGKKGMKDCSREVKLEVVRLYLEEGKTQAEIIKELGINNTRRVKLWLQQYRQEGERAFEMKRRKGLVGRQPKKENQTAYIARLEMEIAPYVWISPDRILASEAQRCLDQPQGGVALNA